MNHHIDSIFNEMIDDVRYIEICSKVYTGIDNIINSFVETEK